MTATDQQMLDMLERWATAKGWLRVRGWRPGDAQGWGPETRGHPWDVAIESGTVWIRGRRPYTERVVQPEVAIAWVLTVEAELPSVTVGPCPACVKRGGSMEWAVAGATRGFEPLRIPETWRVRGEGWGHIEPVIWRDVRVDGKGPRLSEVTVHVASRPCPDCNGSGRDERDPARLLLDAAPKRGRYCLTIGDVSRGAWQIYDGDHRLGAPYLSDETTTRAEVLHGLLRSLPSDAVIGDTRLEFDAFDGRIEAPTWASATVTCVAPGEFDEVARAHVAVLADDLERKGHVLGPILALALQRQAIGDRRDAHLGVEALHAVWERLTVACPSCNSTRLDTDGQSLVACLECKGRGRVLTPTTVACERCNGTGIETVPATPAMAYNGGPRGRVLVQPGDPLPVGLEPGPDVREHFRRADDGRWVFRAAVVYSGDRVGSRTETRHPCPACAGRGRNPIEPTVERGPPFASYEVPPADMLRRIAVLEERFGRRFRSTPVTATIPIDDAVPCAAR